MEKISNMLFAFAHLNYVSAHFINVFEYHCANLNFNIGFAFKQLLYFRVPYPEMKQVWFLMVIYNH